MKNYLQILKFWKCTKYLKYSQVFNVQNEEINASSNHSRSFRDTANKKAYFSVHKVH